MVELSCKLYMHKDWKSYLDRLDKVDQDLSTLRQLCNVPGAIFMMAKLWKMDRHILLPVHSTCALFVIIFVCFYTSLAVGLLLFLLKIIEICCCYSLVTGLF